MHNLVQGLRLVLKNVKTMNGKKIKNFLRGILKDVKGFLTSWNALGYISAISLALGGTVLANAIFFA